MRKEDREKLKHDELVDFAMPMMMRLKESWRPVVAVVALALLVGIAIVVKFSLDKKALIEKNKKMSAISARYHKLIDDENSNKALYNELIDDIDKLKKDVTDANIQSQLDFMRGNSFFKAGVYDKSIAALDESIKNAPEDKVREAGARMIMGHVYQKENKFKEAIAEYEKAGTLYPAAFKTASEKQVESCRSFLSAKKSEPVKKAPEKTKEPEKTKAPEKAKAPETPKEPAKDAAPEKTK